MRSLVILVLALLLQPPVMAADGDPTTEKSNLTILADDRLLVALAPLARDYATANHTPMTVMLKDINTAEHQIEQGLEAHLILTADGALLSRLSDQGLTDVTSRRTVARTQLALVTASRLRKEALLAKRISFAAMLAATPDMPVFASEAADMDGENVGHLLTGYEFSDTLTGRLQIKTDRDEVVEALRDTDALGLMLASDAVAEPDITVLMTLPDAIRPPVAFDAVVLGSESMAEAKAFATYLTTRAAQKTLADFGFQAAPR